MPSLKRNLASLLLFLSVSPLLYSFSHAASTSPPITRREITYMNGLGSDNDYDDDENYIGNRNSPPEVPSSVRTTFKEMQICQYNPCLENQEPCTQLSAKTGCLCPGMSGADVPPHAPRISALVSVKDGEDKGKVEVEWCAPSSVVSKYRVKIEGHEEDSQEFQGISRRGLIRSLEAGTKVCVEAVNNAGHSDDSEFSCKRYDIPDSSDKKLLAGVIGGGVALLVLLILGAVMLWKYQVHQRAKRESTDGLGNPSYSTEGTL